MHYRLRTFLRVPVNAPIVMTLRNADFHGVVADVSLGGFFAGTAESLPVEPGDVFKVAFALPFESGARPIRINAMALRTDPDGIAFRFIETDPHILRLLFSFIYEEEIAR